MLQLDGIIVGAGVLGMLTGLEIMRTSPDLDLAILEKEKFVGEHSSSRNSGVLHAGIYYPFNSFKRFVRSRKCPSFPLGLIVMFPF